MSEEQLLTKPTQNQKPNKNEDPDQERGDPLFAANPGSAAKPTQNLKPNKEETTIERRDPLFAAEPAPLCSDIPE